MRTFFIALLASIGVAVSASAQSPLVVTAQVNGGTVLVPLNGTLPMPSSGGPLSATVLVTNQGTASVTVNQIAVSGTDFALVNSPMVPQALNPGGTLTFAITYRPTSGSSSGQVAINYTQGTQAASFPFTLAGTAPVLSFSVVLPDNTSTAVASGGVVNFPAAAVQSSTSASLVISNTGSTSASVMTAVTGSDFQIASQFSNLVSPGQQIRIPITFTPQAAGTRTGLLTVQWGTSSATFTLQGIGAVPNFVVAYGLTVNKNILPLTDGGFLTFQPTPAKTTAEADVIISNQGTVAGMVKGVSLSGANFQLASLPLLPATLAAGQSLQFAVLFSPQQLGASTGSLRIDLQDRSLTVTVQGTTSAPGFALLYSDPISKNTTTVPDAGTIALANVPVNATAVSTITLQNQGTGTGFVNAITVSGAGFQLTNAPPLPATVNPAGNFQFGLQFAPTQPQNYSGTLRIDYSDKTVIYTLAGSSTGATFSYALVTDQATTPVLTGGVLSFSTPVGQTTSQMLRVTNTGNGDGQIANIAISGAGFQVTDSPALPLTLKTGSSETLTIAFTPTQAGTVNGRLLVGTDSFQLAGTALGSKLAYTYTNTAGTTTVAEGGLVILAPAQVGNSSSVQFTIQNSGTSTATISTISVAGASFSLQNPPALPANIDPGNSMMFSIAFAPNNSGDQTGSLRVNNATFSLVGNGQQPLAVPAYQINGPSGTQQPLQQPAVSLHLASPYSLPLVGTLTLAFVSDVFSSNPAVQFATGGTAAHFTIPANSMDAVFDNGATAVAFQTGTVAGTIKITPAFATQSGLDLTPASPPSLSVTINRSAPQLLSAAMINRGLKNFSIVLTGFSTTRSLKTLTFTLSTSDSRFTGTTITTNVEPAATTWFQSTTSAALGGLFSATVPFTLTGGGSNEDLVQAIQAISVTATNDVGTSSASTVQLQ